MWWRCDEQRSGSPREPMPKEITITDALDTALGGVFTESKKMAALVDNLESLGGNLLWKDFRDELYEVALDVNEAVNAVTREINTAVEEQGG